jgi:uncharacterized membrane protein
MRLGLVIVGVVLAIIGAALLFVPVVPQSNQTISTASSPPLAILSVSGFSLTGSIPVAVSWTANSSVTVFAAACSATCSNVSMVSGTTVQTGTSGSFSLSQPNGGEVALGAIKASGPPSTVTFKLTTALSTVGTVLLIIGIVVLIVGVVLRSGKAKMATAMPPSAPTATTPPVSPPTPPAGGPPMSPPTGQS